VTAALLAGLAKWISGASVRWLDCPIEPRQRVYFANHTSHLDAVVLWASLPAEIRRTARPVAARDYWEKGKLRRWMAARVFRCVLIDRKDVSRRNNPLDLMMQALDQNCSLIVFPEGTRGTGDDVGTFKSGLYHLARHKPEVQFVPAYIENLNRVLPKGEFLPIPMLSSVTFGAPIRLEPVETREAFLTRAREAVCSLRRG